jgi:hypothetical protein
MTTSRTMRLPDDLWHAARVRAVTEHTTVTAVVTAALKRYTRAADVSQDYQERTD